MIVDAHGLQPDQLLNCDICVIGAGAAGITVAREFAGKAIEICLLEGGGLEWAEESQAIYKGQSSGLPYDDLDISRLRYFGGTTNHWNGRCRPLSSIDFERRSWVEGSGWPIAREDLLPFYRRAHPLLELGSFGYDEEDWRAFGFPVLGTDARKLNQFLWRYSSPVRFGDAYGDELKAAANIRVILNANVTNIGANLEGNAIEGLAFRTFDGRKGRVVAKSYVLACGGIENPRLLLASNDVQQKGLGNEYDGVGRYFMAHANVTAGQIVSSSPEFLVDALGRRQIDEGEVLGGLQPSEAHQKAEEILNAGVRLSLFSSPESGVVAARDIKDSVKAGNLPDDFTEKIWRVIRDIDDVAEATWRRYVDGVEILGPDPVVALTMIVEQAPNPVCRITLTEDRDALGLPRVALHLGLSELHRHTVNIVTRLVAGEVGRLGLGRVQLADWLLDEEADLAPDLRFSSHHMGTTRMADNPRRGVVDKDCRVHGLANLYIAGSSVFPTGGFANPTLTIVALALRLADHLKSQHDRE